MLRLGHPHSHIIMAAETLEIDYRFIACQERFHQLSHRINIQQLVEDFNYLRSKARNQGIHARPETVSFITRHIDLLAVVEDLNSGQEESRTLLNSLVSELYDLKFEAILAH